MRPIPVTPETVEAARRIIWFEEPEKVLAEPIRFMAYAMTYARHEDMQVIRQYVSDEEIRQALDAAPPGIIDPRSWAYWNLRMGRFPPPPLHTRTFDGSRTTAAVEEWRKLREQEPPTDMEEMRRRAVQEWRAKYGPDEKQ